MKNNVVCLVMLIVFCTSCQAQEVSGFLIGIWKVDGKESYEMWEKGNDQSLRGKSYKIKNDQEVVAEKLSLFMEGNKLIYEATVLNQNQGKKVQFVLNESVTDAWSFENADHDFPTKIIYQKRSVDTLFVQVLGADGKGFSFEMSRQ